MSKLIELAPQHKVGLTISKPVMIASGCGGYGLAYRPLIDLSVFGRLLPIPLRYDHGPARLNPAWLRLRPVLSSIQGNKTRA